MGIVITNVGATEILRALFIGSGFDGFGRLSLRLFVNDKIPYETDTDDEYEEAYGGGYSHIEIDKRKWEIFPNSNRPEITYPLQSFRFSGPLDDTKSVYGYYVTRSDGVILLAERFTNKFTPANDGDLIKIKLSMKIPKGA